MKKPLKISLIVIGSVLGSVILGAVGYVSYVMLSYNRVGDKTLDINHNSTLEKVNVGDTYSAMSYNIGFGAYSQDYTFFMDTGYDENGKSTSGYYSKAKSKDAVNTNTNGSIEVVKENSVDFVMFQEVDVNSTRSYHVDQRKLINAAFPTYDNTFALNFHTAYLPWPLYDMHGSVKSGLNTISKYKIQSAERKQYTVSSSFSKFFDLDRCFSVSIVDVSNGKKLYIVNSHMSAYDKGGKIREKQLSELNAFLQSTKDNGDYVVVGGDFNHDLLTNNPDFEYTATNRPFGETKKDPDWVSFFFNENKESPLIDGFKVVSSDNVPSCRNNDIEWEEGKTYTCVVDGFIVSDNIQVVSHRNIQTKGGNKGTDGFAFSDHQPAVIEFKLI